MRRNVQRIDLKRFSKILLLKQPTEKTPTIIETNCKAASNFLALNDIVMGDSRMQEKLMAQHRIVNASL